MPVTRRFVAAVLGSAFFAAACGSSPDLRPPVFSSAAPDSLRAKYPAKIHHEIIGDSTYTLETESIVDIYEAQGTSIPTAVWILTASAGAFDVTLSDGSLLLWSADLSPGQYEGPGTYTIDGLKPPKDAQASSLRSAAYVQIARPVGGEDSLRRYDQLNQPCTLTFEANAARGRVECPELGLDRDPSRTISWTWTWERLPAEGS